ncbi:hypothetical protein ALC62_12113 [Cyphomyrmex costatus]|uniref:Uncharacterized protein n=1 Tax=Cyphomyrmex costatus TaxID=456900 RepID=A0A151IBZ2_9HYME|nr:hypothetical protein ALC62_12113 [Cyphomyrmex costatus]
MSSYNREWLKNHCREKETLPYSSKIRCAYCDEVFRKNEKNYIRRFIKHLDEHGQTELDYHPKRAKLKREFKIMENYVGVCRNKRCKLSIIFFRGVHLLENHKILYHGDRSKIYKYAIKQNMGDTLLNNYLIMNNKAKCLICKYKMNLTNLESQTEETIHTLKNHWAKHFRNSELNEIYQLEQLQQNIDEINSFKGLCNMIRKGLYFKDLFDQETDTKNVEKFEEMVEEVVDRKECSKLFNEFNIWKTTNSEGICICCLRKVTYDSGKHIIRNHWEYYHGRFSEIYTKIIDLKMVCDILDQYIIINHKLVCNNLNCTESFKVKVLQLNVEEQLVILFKHWQTHIGTSSDDQMKQEKQLREKIRQRLNEKEDQLNTNLRKKDSRKSHDCDKNTSKRQLDKLHPQEQQRLYEQYIEQIIEHRAIGITSHITQKDTTHKEKENDLKEFDKLMKNYYMKPVIKMGSTNMKCLKCNTMIWDSINNERSFYLLRNHFETYHGKLSYIYKRIMALLIGYKITDSILWCTVCSANLNIETNVETTNEKVIALFLHWSKYHS